jgi:hypothetical protein
MDLNEVSPPGWGHTKGPEEGGSAEAFDKARKEGRFKGSKSDMFAIMWAGKNKGDKTHYKEKSNPPEKKKEYKEAMNFSEFCESLKDPLYEVLGKDNKMPMCPVGYKWNNMTMRCEPKTAKDGVQGPRDGKMPHGQHHYNVIGSSGYDGGWAFQEKPTPGTENMGQ